MAMLCGHLVIIALVKTHHHMMLSSPVMIKKRNNAVVTILLTSELFRSSRLTSNRPTRHSLRHRKASLYAVIALLSFMGMSLDSSHSPLLVSPGQSKPLSYSQRLPYMHVQFSLAEQRLPTSLLCPAANDIVVLDVIRARPSTSSLTLNRHACTSS
jgi:hypothetical protein